MIAFFALEARGNQISTSMALFFIKQFAIRFVKCLYSVHCFKQTTMEGLIQQKIALSTELPIGNHMCRWTMSFNLVCQSAFPCFAGKIELILSTFGYFCFFSPKISPVSCNLATYMVFLQAADTYHSYTFINKQPSHR